MLKTEIKSSGTGTITRGKTIYSDEISIKNIRDRKIFLETSQRILTNGIYKIEVINKNKEKKQITGVATSSVLRSTQKNNGDNVPIYEVGIKFMELNDFEKQFLDEIAI